MRLAFFLRQGGENGAYDSIRFAVVERTDFATGQAADTRRPNVLFIVSEDNSEQIGLLRRGARSHSASRFACRERSSLHPRLRSLFGVQSFALRVSDRALPAPERSHRPGDSSLCVSQRFQDDCRRYLQEAGYYTGFIGKTHVNPESIVEDYVDFRGVRHANFNNTFSIEGYAAEARTIFDNAKSAKKPFLAIMNYSDAHRKFIGKSKAGYPTVQVEGDIPPLPWIGCDTPKLREEMRNYLNCMNRLDEGIGLVLKHLD